MAVTWDVLNLKATKTVGSLSNVVTALHWTASEEDAGHSAYRYGRVGLAEANSESFTAYSDITKDDAVAWAKDALGADEVTAIETSIAAQITESKTPTTSTGVPWS